jgi:predicted ATPase/DNA-binding SARP family transcriptional activator
LGNCWEIGFLGRLVDKMEISYHIRLLGTIQVEGANEPIRDFESRKSLALLGYLVRQDQPVSRSQLADLFWGNKAESRGRRNLSHELSLLSKKLPGCFQADYHMIQFQPAVGYWIDTLAFEALVKQSRGAGEWGDREIGRWGEVSDAPIRSGEETGLRPEKLAEAVALYRGDFMAGYYLDDCPEFETWLLREQELWRRWVTEVLDRLITHHIQYGQDQQAQVYVRRWLALEPWREEAHRQLMLLLARMGNRSAALAQYETCRRFLAEELAVEPAAETVALHEQIKAGELSWGAEEQGSQGGIFPASPHLPISPFPHAPAPLHNLPAQTTPFVGREPELARLADLLTDPTCRLVTILGAGGMGKTYLALAAAAAQLDRFNHGVYLVQLTALQSVQALAPTLAQALNFSFYQGGDPWQQLLDYLRSKQMLLILDNPEHLLASVQAGAGVETWLIQLLNAAADVKILVTSRAKLGLQGEYLLPLVGLEVPPLQPPIAILESTQYSAVELFRQSARRVQPDFQLSADNWPDVAQICRLVGGMPLGIVLAASWLELLSPVEIAAHIQQNLDFLETEGADLPERQRSMRAVFDHSWTLLSGRERHLFAQLSVFRGSFDLRAAQAVTAASLAELRGLVNKSFLQRTPSGRYELHELLRQFGAEKLFEYAPVWPDQDGPGEASAVLDIRDRHSAYYCAFLQAREAGLKGPQQSHALAEIQMDYENIRLAWRWAAEQGQVERLAQAVDSLGFFYDWSGRFQEGENAYRFSAEQLATDASVDRFLLLSRLLTWQALFCRRLGQPEVAGRLFQESLSCLNRGELRDRNILSEQAFVLLEMGKYIAYTDRDEAKQLLEQSLILSQMLGDRWAAARTLASLGSMAWHLSRDEEAKECLQESLAIRQELGDQRGMAKTLNMLGRVIRHQGQLEACEQLQQESLALLQKIGDQDSIAQVSLDLGISLCWLGRFREGLSLLEDSLAISSNLGHRSALALANCHLSEANLHLGKYEQAHAHAQTALTLFREIGDQRGIGFSLGFQGWIASIEEDYPQARQLLQESVVFLRKIRQPVALGFTLASLGGVACYIDGFQQARQYLLESLRIAVETKAFFLLHVASAFVALFLAHQGQPERAMEIYTLATRFPYVGCSRWFEDVVGRHIAAVAATLPPEVVTAAQERGRARDRWATAEELLGRLS